MYYLFESDRWDSEQMTVGCTVVRRLNPDESLLWMAALYSYPIGKSFVIDSKEQYVLIGAIENIYTIRRLKADTGAIIDAQNL